MTPICVMYNSISAQGNTDKTNYWFPMRVSYGRGIEVRNELTRQGIKHYFPSNERIKLKDCSHKLYEAPLIRSLIFVYGTKVGIAELKKQTNPCSFMRFMTYTPYSDIHNGMSPFEQQAARRIIIVPEQEMNSFIEATEKMKEHITLIPYSETFDHIGKRIRIIEGPLTGMEGKLRRIKNNKHVHLDCGGILTAEIDYIPSAMYQLI